MIFFFFPTFAFRRRYAALFLSSFQGGSRVQPPFIASPLPPPCDDIRASPRIFPKPLPLDNEQSFRCALLAGLFCLFVLGIGGCVFHPPPSHPTTTLTSPAPIHPISSTFGCQICFFVFARIPFDGGSSSLFCASTWVKAAGPRAPPQGPHPYPHPPSHRLTTAAFTISPTVYLLFWGVCCILCRNADDTTKDGSREIRVMRSRVVARGSTRQEINNPQIFN